MLSYFRVISMAALVVVAVIAAISHPDPPRKVQTEQASLGGLWEPVLAETYVTAPEPTTTTTVPPAPPETAPQRQPAPVVTAAPQPAYTSLQPCGGDLPPCYVKDRESHGSYSARNPSGACGAWQIIPSTWAGFGGYSSACDAPPEVQDEKARALWNGGAGCSHWSACG